MRKKLVSQYRFLFLIHLFCSQTLTNLDIHTSNHMSAIAVILLWKRILFTMWLHLEINLRDV